MDEFKVIKGIAGDPNFYVIKVYASGATPVTFANCGNVQSTATTVAAALNATV